MDLGRLSNGERIASISAILLFISMFLHWFGSKTVNASNLLVALQGFESEKNAWQALDYIPFILVVTISVTLVVAVLRATPQAELPIAINALVVILGIVSALSIIFRVLNPSVIYAEGTVTVEGAVQPPTFLAFLISVGIAFGGCLANWEEGVLPPDLRARRGKVR